MTAFSKGQTGQKPGSVTFAHHVLAMITVSAVPGDSSAMTVTSIHLLPDQVDVTAAAYWCGDDEMAEAGAAFLNENTWAPLEDLPDSIEWEG